MEVFRLRPFGAQTTRFSGCRDYHCADSAGAFCGVRYRPLGTAALLRRNLFVSYVLYARCSHVTKISIGLISQKRRYHSAKSVNI
jgi:hypothetical protein